MITIKYHLKSKRMTGYTDDGIPQYEDCCGPECQMPYSEANLELARSECWEEPEIIDDGEPEPEAVPTVEDTLLDVVADQEYRLCILDLGGA